MTYLLLAAALFSGESYIQTKERPIYQRDLVSMQGYKMMASLAPDTIKNYPNQTGDIVIEGTLTVPTLTVTGLTEGRVPYVSTGGLLADDADFAWVNSTGTLNISLAAGQTGYVATLGSELVTNGTFTGNATGWTLGGGGGAPDWAYASNNVTHASGGGTTALSPSTPLVIVAAAEYELSFVVSSYATGTLTPTLGGTAGAAVSANGTYIQHITATNTNNLLLTPSNDFAATLDTVSVKLVTPANPYMQVGGASQFVAGTFNGFSTFLGVGAGRWAPVTTQSVGIGAFALLSASTGATRNIAIGYISGNQLTTGTHNVFVGALSGQLLRGGLRNSCVGNGTCNALTYGNDNVCFGAGSCATGQYSNSGGIGSDAIPTADNQLVIGGNTAGKGFTTIYLGSGATKASPSAFTLRGTVGSGSNNAGSNFTIAPGAGTGTAAGGDIFIQRSPSIATGSTAQTLADAFVVRSQFKTLGAASATAFARLNIAQAVAGINGWCGGEAHVTIIANTAAAAVVQTYTTSVNFACHNLAGTESCSFGTISSAADNTPTGTITAPTFDANSGATDTIDLRITTDSDQAETTLAMFWSLIVNGTCTVTPQ